MQTVDDRIVLAREQRVHARQPDPPIAVDGGELLQRVAVGGSRVERQMTVFVEVHFSVRQQHFVR